MLKTPKNPQWKLVVLANEGKKVPLETIAATDRLKTGEMIRVSAVLGCIAAGADEEKIKAA